jgi:hypothetical protein
MSITHEAPGGDLTGVDVSAVNRIRRNAASGTAHTKSAQQKR